MRKRSLIAALGAVALVGALVGAAGAGFNLSAPTVNPNVGPPGTTFTVSGTGCTTGLFGGGAQPQAVPQGPGPGANVSVTAQFVPTPVTKATVPDVGGNWSVQFTVPADAQPGSINITSQCIDESGGCAVAVVADCSTANETVGFGKGVRAQVPTANYPTVTFTVTAAHTPTHTGPAATPVVAAPVTTG